MTRRISCARLRRPVRLVLLKLHPKSLQFFWRRVILGGSLVPELQRPRLARRRIADFYLQADRILPSPFGKCDQSAGYNPAIQQIKNPRYFQLWTSEGTSAKSGYPRASSSFGCGAARLGASVFEETPISPPPTDVVT